MKIIITLLLTAATLLSAQTEEKIKINIASDASSVDKQLVKYISRNYETDIKTCSLDEALTNVKSGKADIAIGNITITGERERTMDFTIPYNNSPVKILARDEMSTWAKVAIFGSTVAGPVLWFILFLVVTGLIFRQIEPDLDGDGEKDKFFTGWIDGSWLSLNLSATTGLGDKAPSTVPGKVFAAFVIFIGIMFFGMIIGIAGSTWSKCSNINYEISDLKRMNVGTIKGSSASEILDDASINPTTFSSIQECVISLYKGDIDCIMYDECILEEFAKDGFVITDKVYLPQQYGIAVPQNSKYRDLMNKVIYNYK